MGFGVSFVPGLNGESGEQDRVKRRANQSLVELRSLRLPNVSGANSIAPAPLLKAPMQSPDVNTAMVQQALMALAGMGGPSPEMAPRVPPPMAQRGVTPRIQPVPTMPPAERIRPVTQVAQGPQMSQASALAAPSPFSMLPRVRPLK